MGLISPLPNFSLGCLPKRESAKANTLLENVCCPGVSPGAAASNHLCRMTDAIDTEETIFLLLASAMKGKQKAVYIQISRPVSGIRLPPIIV